MSYNAVDLFAGCGGMTEGLINAGFHVIAAVEVDKYAADTYRLNHNQHGVSLFEEDIRSLDAKKILDLLKGEPLHLLAGCPPCQGFSSLRRKNKKRSQRDSRNNLILEYLRFVEELQPISIMLENVPGLENYSLFQKVFSRLNKLGYSPQYKVLDVSHYGVPQRRKRLVLVGSLLEKLDIPSGSDKIRTVRDYIGSLESAETTKDPAHKRFPKHGEKVMERIRLTPHDGGSRKDLPDEYTLDCHKNKGVGFNDVYGRLRWDSVSSTITGGCLNPSKGRFLHPEEDRCITAREAALLQTFRKSYVFPEEIPITNIALMIGNALPPLFCEAQSKSIRNGLDKFFLGNMEAVDLNKRKSADISTEVKLRKLLTKMGFKYRLSSNHFSFKPDIIFSSSKKVIIISGCFWHGHECQKNKLPRSNKDFWKAKAIENKKRLKSNCEELKKKGWSYLVVQQCEVETSNLEDLKMKLIDFLA